ncbi:MAG: hypothetical protein DA408_17340 [Bacteroidetes bacterium]|nr:MAG: hypothetical protein C7N36_03125 [Bacteroidota bacterium]PTM09872.1 MAG: hypothetical protein DA408_17340 [Bacteroidota bacterium]
MIKRVLLGFVLLFALAFSITACKNEQAGDASTAPPAPAATAPAGATSTVEHYTCPNGHLGYGSGTAGTCSQCSATLVHNQAFHANDAAPAPNPAIQTQDPTGTATPPPPAAAQNAAGVWHYTCASGCAGGAGAATACATCGSTLAHNQAYHN